MIHLPQRIRRSLRKNLDEGRALLSRQMPAFVTRSRPGAISEIPAFTFHDVDPSRFARQLEFLSTNGYRAVDADELAEGGPADRRVALTFDDATWTFWAYAYPLLMRFGFRAILFAVPGVIPEASGVRPTLVEGWPGRMDRGAVEHEDRGPALCTWPEIVRLHTSGIVDVQSHSLSHLRVPIAARVVDFLHPDFDTAVGRFEIPLSSLDRRTPPERLLRLGAPVYASESRLAGRRRFHEDPALTEALMSHVRARGGEAFFQRPGWRRSLRGVLTRHPREERGEYETAAEREVAILHEITESKRRLEERLDGKVVRHFAYPWHRGSRLADRMAADSGYRSVFYGSHLRETVESSTGAVRVRRLPERYLLRLPGSGRVPFIEAVREGRRSPPGGRRR